MSGVALKSPTTINAAIILRMPRGLRIRYPMSGRERAGHSRATTAPAEWGRMADAAGRNYGFGAVFRVGRIAVQTAIQDVGGRIHRGLDCDRWWDGRGPVRTPAARRREGARPRAAAAPRREGGAGARR